jgi:hypothetical protein
MIGVGGMGVVVGVGVVRVAGGVGVVIVAGVAGGVGPVAGELYWGGKAAGDMLVGAVM